MQAMDILVRRISLELIANLEHLQPDYFHRDRVYWQ